MSAKGTKCSPPTPQQKAMLIEFLNTYPQLVKNKFTGSFTIKDAERLWQQLTVQLNTSERGAVKTWRQWRRTWADLKRGAINKRSQIRKHACGTGGGPKDDKKWDDADENIASLISDTAINGDLNVPEPMITFDFSDYHATAHCEEEPTNPPCTSISRRSILQEVQNKDSPSCSVEDHNYTKPSTKPLTPPSTQRKTSRVKRLQKSQELSKELLNLSKENILYKKQKLQLLEERLNVEKENLAVQKKILAVLTQRNEL